MTSEPRHDGRESRLDEAVLACLKAQEENPHADPATWFERYPDLKEELADFFRDQDRIGRLASLVRQVTGGGETRSAGDATFPWSKPVASGLQVDDALDDYELLEVVGRGGMGIVYKAQQRSLKRIVALKVILAGAHADDDELARFRGDAEAVACLQHPNIVHIHEVGELNRTPFFSLEFIEGGSLAKHLTGSPLDPRLAAQLVRTLTDAVHFAHLHGVVHRDLKPANVLLQRSSGKSSSRGVSAAKSALFDLQSAIPKITDFGLAKRLDAESGRTKSGAILGTPSYMAPEQAEGGEVGPAADIYGLGAILYELLAGRPPFKGATPWETINQVLHDEPASPRSRAPRIGLDLETICLKCLEKDPHDRYVSAEALGDDLRRYLEGRPIAARPVGRTTKFWRLCRRHPGASASLAFAVVALLTTYFVAASINTLVQRQFAQKSASQRELRTTLVKQVAHRIDRDLRNLASIARSMAATFPLRADWSEAQLSDWLSETLASDPRLSSVAVALEPTKREAIGLRATRRKNRVETAPLPQDFRDLAWYKEPGKWSEPTVGTDNKPMVTYSTPIRRKGEFAGVVMVELSVDFFDALQKELRDVNFGTGSDAFLLDSSARPLVASDRPLPSNATIHGEAGSIDAVDPATGRLSVFTFAPIRSSRWFLVAVTEP